MSVSTLSGYQRVIALAAAATAERTIPRARGVRCFVPVVLVQTKSERGAAGGYTQLQGESGQISAPKLIRSLSRQFKPGGPRPAQVAGARGGRRRRARPPGPGGAHRASLGGKCLIYMRALPYSPRTNPRINKSGEAYSDRERSASARGALP